MPSFSVVMSVYRADDPRHFLEAVNSVLSQTTPPSELIIAVDGPVESDIERILGKIGDQSTVRILRLATNQGLGASRHTSILAAKHEFIAVMDADDISVPDRFERQLEHLVDLGVDVVGGFIEEFDETPGDAHRIRMVPLAHAEILSRGKWRQPMNHVTIMFNRSAYISVGGYHMLRGVEDYDLFHRMFIGGVRFANLPYIMVHVRSGAAVITRRRGLDYLRQELALIRRMRKSRFLNIGQWAANSCLRIVVRLLPSRVIGLIYLFLRERGTPEKSSSKGGV